MICHGNPQTKKWSAYFMPVELEIIMRTYSEYEHTFNRKSRTAAVAKERINIETEFANSLII